MKLTEIFNAVATAEWEQFSGSWYAGFEIGEHEYGVSITKRNDSNIPELVDGYYMIVFGIDDGDVMDTDIRGVGNEYQVFANVTTLLRKFLSKYPNMPMMMSAKEGNRASLYTKMVSRLLPNWSVTQHPSESGSTVFVMIPPQ